MAMTRGTSFVMAASERAARRGRSDQSNQWMGAAFADGGVRRRGEAWRAVRGNARTWRDQERARDRR